MGDGWIVGVDLANGPDCSVRGDGTVIANPYWEDEIGLYEETQG